MLVGALLTMLFRHLSYPLLWHDESDTVMFGQRVLEYGYPKVHGERNVVYGLRQDQEIGVDSELDAYLGSPWAQYYYAAIGVAHAAATDDLYEKTARLRLPFAVAGAAGLLVLLLALLPAVEGRAPRRQFAIGFVLLAICSTSLLLHLREARYYSLAVLLAAGIVYVFARHHVYRSLGYGAYCAALVTLLFLLCNTFYPLFGVLVATLGVHHLARALASRAPWRDRLQRLLRDGLPVAAALVAVVPGIAFLNLFAVTSAFMDLYVASPENSYPSILRTVALHMLRFEFLGPVVVSRIAVFALGRGRTGGEGLRRRRELASFLFLFCAVHWIVVARTPFFYERYYLAIGPMLIAILMLDLFSIAELARTSAFRAVRAGALGAVGAALAVSVLLRVPEMSGQLHELRVRYRGPLDYLIPYLNDSYADPTRLVIATDYEEPSLMYYLGSHVIVGYYGANLERDLELDPDVIIPRYWPAQKAAIDALRARGDWVIQRFPVAGLPANNVPSLSPRNQASGFTHQFETVRTEVLEHRAYLLEDADLVASRQGLRGN